MGGWLPVPDVTGERGYAELQCTEPKMAPRRKTPKRVFVEAFTSFSILKWVSLNISQIYAVTIYFNSRLNFINTNSAAAQCRVHINSCVVTTGSAHFLPSLR